MSAEPGIGYTFTQAVKGTEPGIVYTFYSYKGGVGRSMAVANIAALLAKWGHSVLVVDWDLEAPGIERFFANSTSEATGLAESKPGIVDLINAMADGQGFSWEECVHRFFLKGSSSPVSVISAGRRSEHYVERMQHLDFPALFESRGLGAYIEKLRSEWVLSFEFVLIDSRTGVTDIGGICTVHLADVLVLVFTATNSSVEGGLDIVNRAREARNHLPLDRGRLIVVPLPARDESRTEYQRAAEWKGIFKTTFEPMYREWLPSGTPVEDAIEILKIPYIPYWSFGERVAAVEESATDPAGLAYAYEVLGRLLASRLDWTKALNGNGLLAPPPRVERRYLDHAWGERQFTIAEPRLASVNKTGFVEIHHCCVDSPIDRSQDRLVAAARQAVVHTLGWPLGAVLDTEDARPTPNNEGIVASIKREARGGRYEYWALSRKGDFYGLMSLPEDETPGAAIAFDTRIVRVTEGLLHCANLYRLLGADSRATVQFRVRYGGLRGRTLTSASGIPFFPSVNQNEDETTSQIEFRLDQVESQITQLVKKLCADLFMLFDFFNPPESVYQKLVSNFVAGKIAPI